MLVLCCCCFTLLCSARFPYNGSYVFDPEYVNCYVVVLILCDVFYFSRSRSLLSFRHQFFSRHITTVLVCSIASTYFDRTLESICSAQNNNTQRATFLSKGKPISVPHGALHFSVMITRYQQHKFCANLFSKCHCYTE